MDNYSTGPILGHIGLITSWRQAPGGWTKSQVDQAQWFEVALSRLLEMIEGK